MKRLALITLLGLGLSSTTLATTDAKTEQLSKEHESLFASLDHLQVDFTQKIFTALRKKTRTRQGKAAFSKPGSFHWAFTDKGAPVEEYFYDGTTLSHYVIPDKVVTHYGTRSGLQQELEAIVHLVLDAQKLFNQYQVVDTRKEGDLTRLKLTPRKKGQSDISSIEVAVASTAPKYVKEVKIEYENGNQTSFSFANPVTTPIPAERYRFTNPGGVKVNRMG